MSEFVANRMAGPRSILWDQPKATDHEVSRHHFRLDACPVGFLPPPHATPVPPPAEAPAPSPALSEGGVAALPPAWAGGAAAPSCGAASAPLQLHKGRAQKVHENRETCMLN